MQQHISEYPQGVPCERHHCVIHRPRVEHINTEYELESEKQYTVEFNHQTHTYLQQRQSHGSSELHSALSTS